MRELRIGKNDAGQRVDKFLSKALCNMPPSLLYKSIRTKKIKLNRARVTPSRILEEGDTLQLFLRDEFFGDADADQNETVRRLKSVTPHVTPLYEDEHIILLHKRPGVSVHEDENQTTDNLITHLQAYLYKKGAYDPASEQSFAPALCNRIDRNTGGIVIAAKDAEALRIMNEKIRDREIDKYYLAAVHGTPRPPEAVLSAYLYKHEKGNIVTVSDRPSGRQGEKDIRTGYRVLKSKNGLSLLEVRLFTGRTHQIRAHMAHVGHPLLGDGKYGINRADAQRGYKHQALYAYKLRFSFKGEENLLSYLDGREFSIPPEDIYFTELFK